MPNHRSVGDETQQSLVHKELTRREFGGAAVRLGGASVAAGLLPSILAACGSESGSGSVNQVTLALAEEVVKLDSARSLELGTAQMMNSALEGLLVIEGEFGSYELAPRLATKWDQADPLTYVYELRDGVKFWDGTPLTVDDVVFSMNRSANDEANWAFSYAAVDKIEATGPMEVTIRLKSQDPAFQWQPAFSPGLIVSKAFVEKHGDKVGTAGVLTMGTGPYQFTEFVPGERLTLERFEDYWDDPPPVQKIIIETIPDRNTQLLAARTGEIDGAIEVPLDQGDQWEGVDGMTMTYAPSFAMGYSFFNTTLAPWSDVHVRRAIAHSLDQGGIVSSLLGGHGASPDMAIAPKAAFAPLLSEDEIETMFEQLPAYPFDLDRAKEELAMSSVPNGFSATIETSSEHSVPKTKALENLSSNLKEIGIELNVKDLPFRVWNEHNDNNKSSYNNSLWFLDFPDPVQTLGYFLSGATSEQRPWTNYRNPRIEKLLKQQTTAEPAERGRILMEIMSIGAEDAVFLPLFFSDIAMPLRDNVEWDESLGGLYFNQPWMPFIKPS